MEALQHIIINLALGMILCVPDALLGLLVVCLLVVIVLIIGVARRARAPSP